MMNPRSKITIGGPPFLIALAIILSLPPSRLAQSIGYHPNLNLGFNPYLSQTFGYGLGLPYGAYGLSPLKSPWHLGFASGFDGGLISKLHAKTIVKKLSPSFIGPSYGIDLKEKLAHKKHSELSMVPNTFDYGYGKHYGSAQLPNNPYKSTYGDFYATNSMGYPHSPVHQEYSMSSHYDTFDHPKMKHYRVIKPMLKVGAILTTAALLNKKLLSIPDNLDPSGMIMNVKDVLSKH